MITLCSKSQSRTGNEVCKNSDRCVKPSFVDFNSQLEEKVLLVRSLSEPASHNPSLIVVKEYQRSTKPGEAAHPRIKKETISKVNLVTQIMGI